MPRLRRFDQREMPAIQLEYALYAMQRARDDAHLSAWRAAGFRGPAFELLSRVWAGEASTSAELVDLTRGKLRPEDVAALLEELGREGYVATERSVVTITVHGRETRDAIERETDRVYFAPWPEFDAEWVRTRLEALAKAFTAHPPGR